MFCVRADGTAASRPSRSSGRSCARQTRPAAAVDSCRTGPHSLSILLHHLLPAFALPVPPPFLFLLWNIGAPFVTLHPLPHCAAGIASIGYQLLDSLQVHLGFCFYSGVHRSIPQPSSIRARDESNLRLQWLFPTMDQTGGQGAICNVQGWSRI